MSLYGQKWTIDGVPTGNVKRCGVELYKIIFEREYATLDDLDNINWNNPTVVKLIPSEECPLPSGSFTQRSVSYNDKKRFFTVSITLDRECYGDVSAYVAELETKQEELDQKDASLAAMSSDLDEADSTVETLYERLNEVEARIDVLSAELAEADETVEALYEQLNGETAENESNEEG